MNKSDPVSRDALQERIHREMMDNLDEELELELDDSRLGRLRTEIGEPALEEPLDRHFYFQELLRLQGELVKLQDWVQNKKLKVVVIFEGRDAAGKGGVIKRITQRLNPRVCRVVALPAPNDRERTQWYFQRYVPHLPAGGEIVLFDRSWYNRPGVERVMGFCTEEEVEEFFRSVPEFERMLVRSGTILIKYWFSITDDEQQFRFLMRIHDPLKQWKLSPMDVEFEAAVGGLHQSQGGHVGADEHPRGSLVDRRSCRQEAGEAELHPASLDHHPLRRGVPLGSGFAAACPQPGIPSWSHSEEHVCSGRLLRAGPRACRNRELRASP